MSPMMMVMMTLFLTLAMMTGSGLGSSCLRNEDCASACCSGYGWCVGPQSGDIKDIFRNWSCKAMFFRLDLLWPTAPPLCVGLVWPGDNDPCDHPPLHIMLCQDADCPSPVTGARCCSPWGWCTDHCPQRWWGKITEPLPRLPEICVECLVIKVVTSLY